MPEEHDDFEGIDISGPWGGVRIGSGRVRGAHGDFDGKAHAHSPVLWFSKHRRVLATGVAVVGGAAVAGVAALLR